MSSRTPPPSTLGWLLNLVVVPAAIAVAAAWVTVSLTAQSADRAELRKGLALRDDVAYRYFHAISFIVVNDSSGAAIGGGDQRKAFYFRTLDTILGDIEAIRRTLFFVGDEGREQAVDMGDIQNRIINDFVNAIYVSDNDTLLVTMCEDFEALISRNASECGNRCTTREAVFNNAKAICAANGGE